MEFKCIDDSVVDSQALTFDDAPFQEWSETPNGLSFQQEGLWSVNGWQYATWWDAEWRLAIGRRRLPDGNWAYIRFEDHQLERDDIHNVAVLGICQKDGTIHLSFDHHNDQLSYRVSKPGIVFDPEAHDWAADLFGPVLHDLPGSDAPLDKITYPLFFEFPEGGLQFCYRTGSSGNGDIHLARYEADESAWVYQGCFISSEGDYNGSSTRNAYPHGIGYDVNGRLHVSWCWREGRGANMPRTGKKGRSGKLSNHDLCYTYSDDGGETWCNSDGQVVCTASGSDAIRVDTPGIAVFEIPMATGVFNQVAQTPDLAGRLHVINPRSDYVTYYHDWRDDEGVWLSHKLPYQGVRPALTADQDNNLFLAFRHHEDGKLRVAMATGDSGWTDWTLLFESEAIFADEPLVDLAQWREDGVLSVYVQEKASVAGAPSALHVLSFEIQ